MIGNHKGSDTREDREDTRKLYFKKHIFESKCNLLRKKAIVSWSVGTQDYLIGNLLITKAVKTAWDMNNAIY